MVNVLVPVAGGINYKGVRRTPNLVKKTSKYGDGKSDAAITLTGEVRADPRADPMAGDIDKMGFLMTYNVADQNEGCVSIQQMQPGMMGGRVINPNKTLGTESMRARALPSNGNEPSLAWGACDLVNKNPEHAKKHLRSFNNHNWQIAPPFKANDGIHLLVN